MIPSNLQDSTEVKPSQDHSLWICCECPRRDTIHGQVQGPARLHPFPNVAPQEQIFFLVEVGLSKGIVAP